MTLFPASVEPIPGSGDHRLTQADAAVVRWNSRVGEDAEAGLTQAIGRARQEQEVLEDPTRQRHGTNAGALADELACANGRISETVVEP